jgi:hypothetical protein
MPAMTEPQARALVQRMLRETFAGAAQLRAQLGSAVLAPTERDGCWSFQVVSQYLAMVHRRVPVQAEATDSDGVPLHASLHVVGGVLHELEAVREDGGPVLAWPETAEWVTDAL